MYLLYFNYIYTNSLLYRVAMMGVLGMLVQNVVHLPSGAYSDPNPISAIYSVPEAAWFQIIGGIW